MFLSLCILDWKSAADDECPVSSICRIIRKPDSVSCCMMHVFFVSFVYVADVCVSGAMGSEQSICLVCRFSAVFHAMTALALVIVWSELHESAVTKSHSVSVSSWFWKRAAIS